MQGGAGRRTGLSARRARRTKSRGYSRPTQTMADQSILKSAVLPASPMPLFQKNWQQCYLTDIETNRFSFYKPKKVSNQTAWPWQLFKDKSLTHLIMDISTKASTLHYISFPLINLPPLHMNQQIKAKAKSTHSLILAAAGLTYSWSCYLSQKAALIY